MAKPTLKAEKRKITGRKVKKLRRVGILPANLYGKDVKSVALQVPLGEFQKIYEEVGESGLVDLVFDKESRPILIHGVQLHPVTDLPLHVDFHQVSLTEKTTTMIPIELVGESPAVEQKLGILIQPLSEVEVEALPQDLPEHFEVNISNMVQVGNIVTVANIKADPKIEIKANPEEVVAKIDELAKEEVVAPPPPAEGEEVPVEAGAAAPTEGEEVPARGATPAQEKPAEGEKKKEA